MEFLQYVPHQIKKDFSNQTSFPKTTPHLPLVEQTNSSTLNSRHWASFATHHDSHKYYGFINIKIYTVYKIICNSFISKHIPNYENIWISKSNANHKLSINDHIIIRNVEKLLTHSISNQSFKLKWIYTI